MSITPYPGDGWVLSRVANGFFWTGVTFYRLGETCKDRFIVDSLVPFFWAGYYYCWHEEGTSPPAINGSSDYAAWVQKGLGQFFRDLDVDLWYTVQRSISIFDHWTINELINRVWPDWNSFRSEPERFVRERLADYVGIPPAMRNSWQEFWYAFWDRLAPDINQIRVNPTYWVTSKLNNALAGVTEFLSDPIGKIVDWLNDRAAWFSGFLAEPQKRIVDWLNDRSGWFGGFIADARGTVQGWLNSWLGLPGGFWADPRRGMIDWLVWHWSANFAVYREQLYMRVHELLTHVLDDEYW